MNEIRNNLLGLKICCVFTERLENEQLTTELEKDLVKIMWDYLGSKGDLCENCVK